MSLLTKLFQKIADVAARRTRNDKFYAYTIHGSDGNPYLTRVLLPRIFGFRPMLHHIHRPDEDRDPHDHPWDSSHAVILSGGYVEHRFNETDNSFRTGILVATARELRPGQVNHIMWTDRHLITEVKKDTWTLFIAGERVQEWGFWPDSDRKIPWKEYLRAKGWGETVPTFDQVSVGPEED